MELLLSEDLDPFFDKNQFFGLTTDVRPAKLCFLLKNYLNLQFTRNPETDIAVINIPKKSNKKVVQSLFETQVEEEPQRSWFFHALIKAHFPSSQKPGYFYQNKVQRSILLKELSSFDYIFASPLRHENQLTFIEQLRLIPEIRHIHPIDIYNVKDKNYLLL